MNKANASPPVSSNPAVFPRFYGAASGALFLIATGFLLYGQVIHFQFTHLDDALYVAQNPHLQKGFTREAVQWAFGADLFYDSPNADRWQPLVFLSRMLDVRLFGMNAGAHHAMSLFWHLLNAVLVFFLFLRMTGKYWRSLAVALLFVMHPVQAEPVAWITARKDLISGFFALLAMHVYVSYAGRPSRAGMAGVVFLHACALMSKSVMVILPVLLLCLDFWPLSRMKEGWGRLPGLLREKGVLFLLSLAAVPVAFLGVPSAVGYAKPLTVALKMFPAWFFYLGKWAAPWQLGFYGPDSSSPAWPGVILSVAVFFGLGFVALLQASRRPWLAAAFVWFAAGVAPVAGLEFPGDRFLYLPACALSWTVVWFLGEWAETSAPRKKMAAGFLVFGWIAMAALTARQTATWQTSETLFRHALKINPRNALAMNDLGVYYGSRGRHEEAAALFTRALGISADRSDFYSNLGAILSGEGKNDEALQALRKSENLNPYNPRTHNNLANIYLQRGDNEEAKRHYEKALEIKPDYGHALNNLGVTLSRLGSYEDAGKAFQRAVKVDPSNAVAYKNWAQAFLDQGRRQEALEKLYEAERLNPEDVQIHNNLGATLSELNRAEEALSEFLEALRLNPDFAPAAFNAGHAHWQMGHLEEARRYFSEALRINPNYDKARLGLSLLDQQANPGSQTSGGSKS